MNPSTHLDHPSPTPEPDPLIVAVTGHRLMDASAPIEAALEQVFSSIIAAHPGRKIELFCPLAEGADQLAALVAERFSAISLTVILPMALENYLQTFLSSSGKQTCTTFLTKADRVITLPDAKDAESSFQQLGEYLNAHADVFLAIWNGAEVGESGGTAEVVTRARQRGTAIYWIYSNNHRPGADNPLMWVKKTGDFVIINCHLHHCSDI